MVFHKANEIAITRPKWLSTFIIELKPYENFFNRLSEDLGKARITVHGIEWLYDFPFKQDYGGNNEGIERWDWSPTKWPNTLWSWKITLNCMPYTQTWKGHSFL